MDTPLNGNSDSDLLLGLCLSVVHYREALGRDFNNHGLKCNHHSASRRVFSFLYKFSSVADSLSLSEQLLCYRSVWSSLG